MARLEPRLRSLAGQFLDSRNGNVEADFVQYLSSPFVVQSRGIHLCMGASLVRLQIRIALKELLLITTIVELGDVGAVRKIYPVNGCAAPTFERPERAPGAARYSHEACAQGNGERLTITPTQLYRAFATYCCTKTSLAKVAILPSVRPTICAA